VASVQETFDVDLFGDDHLKEPYGDLTAIRECAPLVWMSAHEAWATARYDVARRVLGNWEMYCSSRGIALAPESNVMLDRTLLASDPPLHTQLRSVLSERLAPKALRVATDFIQAEADQIAADVSSRGRFDAIGDLAEPFALGVVSHLIGLPESVRGKLLAWGDATLNLLGPLNTRAQESAPAVSEMFAWLDSVVKDDLVEGGMGRAIYEAAEAGTIEPSSAPSLLSAYAAAALDTSISLIGLAVDVFAQHPESWHRVRADTSTIPAALLEVARYTTPVRWVSRIATVDSEIDGIAITEGQRIIVLLGGANRDPRHYKDPDTFDIDRKPADHLAFSYGIHSCAGQGLARLEATCLFSALARHVERFESTGARVLKLSNLTRGWQSLPVQVHLA
jgi:cytochrome P450